MSPRAAVFAVLCAAPVACDEPTAPPPDGETLLAAVAAEDYATAWARPPKREERVATAAPHGRFVDIFINGVVEADLAMEIPETGLLAWSEGATIVLEGYDMLEEGALVQIAVMQKRHGVWSWEQYDAGSDRPRFSGRPDLCLGCHAGAEDFVRSFKLPDPPKDE